MTERFNVMLPQRISSVRVIAGSTGGGKVPPPRGEALTGGRTSPGEGITTPAETSPSGVEENQEMLGQLQVEKNRFQTARAALEQAASDLDKSRREMVGKVEDQLLELAIEIARKVLMQEIQAGRYEIEPIVTEALCHVSARQDVVVRLNPEDHAQCGMAHQDGKDGGSDGIRFVPDPAVPPAQCLVETSEGTIESSVEAHLEDMGETLRSAEQVNGDG